MPKTLIVDPAVERKAGKIELGSIPLNAYKGKLEDELRQYGPEALIGIFEDMCMIREFETMLHTIKTEGQYEGIAYDHKGPAHLSIGQEASAVGQAFLLN